MLFRSHLVEVLLVLLDLHFYERFFKAVRRLVLSLLRPVEDGQGIVLCGNADHTAEREDKYENDEATIHVGFIDRNPVWARRAIRR